jgi:hypothetical protein
MIVSTLCADIQKIIYSLHALKKKYPHFNSEAKVDLLVDLQEDITSLLDTTPEDDHG